MHLGIGSPSNFGTPHSSTSERFLGPLPAATVLTEMILREELLDRLAAPDVWGYQHDGPSATEPTATAALALCCAGREEAAERALDWLVRVQGGDGSLGVTATEASPAWPTTLAVLAYAAAGSRYNTRRERAVDWLLSVEGTPIEQTPQLGHDSTLVGWPWIAPTHSWAEPTALAVLALKAAGHADHPRCREAVRLLVDRLLPDGGCNYGNTRVLGQLLRPHAMASGVVLWALAGEDDVPSHEVDSQEVPSQEEDVDRIACSLDYLERQLAEPISAAALAYTVLALAAHDRPLDAAREPLAEVAKRHIESQSPPAPWKLALLALTALEIEPVVSRPRPSSIIGGVTVA